MPAVLAASLRTYLFFLFTTFAVGLVTNVSKTTLGRLRPNFLDVCRPNYAEINCTTTDDYPTYVTGILLHLGPSSRPEGTPGKCSTIASSSSNSVIKSVLSWVSRPLLSPPPDYECPGNPEFGDEASMASAVRDARMSFLSGHATFAFQSMTFGVLYLQGC